MSNIVVPPYIVIPLSNGQTVYLQPNINKVVFVTPSTGATITIYLPAGPYDGQEVRFLCYNPSSANDITATILPQSSASVYIPQGNPIRIDVGGTSTLGSFSGFTFIGELNTWVQG